MSLSDALIKYLDHKFDKLTREHTAALKLQNKLLTELLAFLVHGPEYKEVEMSSAEEDKIDDSAGEYDTETQAKEDIIAQWRQDGYPDDVLKYFK